MPTSRKHGALETLADDVSSLWVPNEWTIPVLEQPPTALAFLRDFVSVSRPCIIRNASNESGVNSLSDLLSLVNERRYPETTDLPSCSKTPHANHGPLRSQIMKVAVTPDGHGDCIRNVESVGPTFVEPSEVDMTLDALLKKLANDQTTTPHHSVMSRVFPTSHDQSISAYNTEQETADVCYYSRQNDCLRTELPHVWEALNVPDTFDWAEQAFGTGPPDAMNLWVGNHRAVSSMHKDHYENLFLVLAGEKVFTLCPPSDVPFLYERPFPCGTFCKNEESWFVQMKQDTECDTTAQWIAADVTRRDEPSCQHKFPLLRHAHPVTIHVKTNEMLYLPSLWFHRVTQTQTTLAVNYWYDMHFDSPQWCYFHYLQAQAASDSNDQEQEEPQG